MPDGAATAVLQQVAINGNRVVALGQASGRRAGTVPFAELSVDGGATWQQAPFSSPGPDTAFTALTADSAGFTAAGLFGAARAAGRRRVDVGDRREMEAVAVQRPQRSRGPADHALASSGSAVTGIGSIVTQPSQQTVTFTLPRPLRKSHVPHRT